MNKVWRTAKLHINHKFAPVHTMKADTIQAVEVQLYSCVTSVLNAELSVSFPGQFNPAEKRWYQLKRACVML